MDVGIFWFGSGSLLCQRLCARDSRIPLAFCHGHKILTASLSIHPLIPHRKVKAEIGAQLRVSPEYLLLIRSKKKVFPESPRRLPHVSHWPDLYPMVIPKSGPGAIFLVIKGSDTKKHVRDRSWIGNRDGLIAPMSSLLSKLYISTSALSNYLLFAHLW